MYTKKVKVSDLLELRLCTLRLIRVLLAEKRQIHVCDTVAVYITRCVRMLYVADKFSSHADEAQNNHKSFSKLSSSSKQESSYRTSSLPKDSSRVNDSEDTDPSRVKTLCDSPDHISAKLNQRILSADHSVTTSNIASSVASDDSNSSNNADSVPMSTASQRPKTVKTLGSKMRSTGKRQTSCQAFPHGVTFHCHFLITFSHVLIVCQLSDETFNVYVSYNSL